MVNKSFKISKGEELEWNLPSSIADYANLHFKNLIPDKGINEKILTENVPSNLQEVPLLEDFLKTLDKQRAISTEKFQDKILQVKDALSQLWKGFKDFRNESSKAVEVPADIFATFI